MIDEYPDPDEEFDLLHQEDYEALKELEDDLSEKRQFSQPGPSGISKVVNNNKHKAIDDVSKSTNFDEIDKKIFSNNRKRGYEELFGDISDLLETDISAGIEEPKEKKLRWDQPEDVIKKILDARQLIHEHTRDTHIETKYDEKYKNSISLRVPPWNFIAVTRSYDSQRLYIRIRNAQNDVKRSIKPVTNLLSVSYGQIKAQAKEVLAKKYESIKRPLSDSSDMKNIINDELWVDKYRPRSYLDLLSDETINRQLLHWLKLWDKIVFNRNIKSKEKQLPELGEKKAIDDNSIEEIDSKGYPIKKIALLSGAPGLGKTTLAYIAARHTGYNVVEINASDERSPDTFRQILLASTEMKAVMGTDPRPNCLIFDEIDGAPVAAIELLLRYVQGKLAPKNKKGKGHSEKTFDGCTRPILCICNEPYAPSLRTLRAAAVIIPVPQVSALRLAERLMEIAKKEKLNIDFGDLIKIAERSGCDIRSCVGVLQYMGNASLKDNLSLGLKDTCKNLFDSWRSILTIPMNKEGMLPISERIDNILKTVHNGETEKLVQGIFHNYPEIYDHKLDNISISLKWFQFYDIVTSIVMHKQVWSLMPYTSYGFIAWHLYFARTQKAKLSYPNIVNEVTQKSMKNASILTAIRRVCGYDSLTLTTEIASFLPDLLTPRLRTVPSHLYSRKEKADFVRIVNIMLEFGLSFIQEKNLQGGYIYSLDPNILEIGIFPECNVHRCLAYAVQQIISQELEVERLKRASIVTGLRADNSQNAKTSKNSENGKDIQNKSFITPNNVEVLKKNVTPLKEIIYKDFFGNIITNETENIINQKKNHISPKSRKEYFAIQNILTKHGLWYKYKEGCNNAVRRSVFIERLL